MPCGNCLSGKKLSSSLLLRLKLEPQFPPCWRCPLHSSFCITLLSTATLASLQLLQAHSLLVFSLLEGSSPHILAQQTPAQKDNQVIRWHVPPSSPLHRTHRHPIVLSMLCLLYLGCTVMPETFLVIAACSSFWHNKQTVINICLTYEW